MTGQAPITLPNVGGYRKGGRIIKGSSTWPTAGNMLSIVLALDGFVHFTPAPWVFQLSMLKQDAQRHRARQKHTVERPRYTRPRADVNVRGL